MTETTIPELGVLDALQKEIADFILADSFFSNVPVITAIRGDILNQVNIAIANLGLSVVIEMFEGNVTHQNVGSSSIDLKVLCTVHENVVINRSDEGTGKTATDTVVRLLAIFNPLNGKPLPCNMSGFTLVNDLDNQLIYQCAATAKAGWTLRQE